GPWGDAARQKPQDCDAAGDGAELRVADTLCAVIRTSGGSRASGHQAVERNDHRPRGGEAAGFWDCHQRPLDWPDDSGISAGLAALYVSGAVEWREGDDAV